MFLIILYFYTFILFGCNQNNTIFFHNLRINASMNAKKQILNKNNNIDFNHLIEKALPSVVKVFLILDEIKEIEGNKYHIQSILSTGSGFIIEGNKIITNYHVLTQKIENKNKIKYKIIIENKEKELHLIPKIKVQFNGGELFPFNIFNYDKYSDIAIIKPINKNINYLKKPLSFGNSNNTKIGNIVIAIGSPLMTFNSCSLGIISSSKIYQGNNVEIGKYSEYLQTDASISKGNSGGPLIGIDGKVIGMISNKIIEKGMSNDISFAITSNYINKILPFLSKGLPVSRTKVNIKIKESSNGLFFPKNNKVIVSEINENNYFRFEKGDQIIFVNNNKVLNKEDFYFFINNQFEICETNITVLRNNSKISLNYINCNKN